MIYDHELVDQLSVSPVFQFDGEAFRATRRNLDPLTPSLSGGRWAPKNICSVLYTSLERDGAIAELAFHWNQFTPAPSRLANLHRISVTTGKTIRLLKADLESLGVNWASFGEISNARTQQIGAAVAFLECDGLIAPSARWNCENLMLFCDHHELENQRLEVVSTEEIDWFAWAQEHRIL